MGCTGRPAARSARSRRAAAAHLTVSTRNATASLSMAADPLTAAAANLAAATSTLPASAAQTATWCRFRHLEICDPARSLRLKNRAQAPLSRKASAVRVLHKTTYCKAMTTETQPQIKEFQAETKQVLRLVMIHRCTRTRKYLRELISKRLGRLREAALRRRSPSPICWAPRLSRSRCLPIRPPAPCPSRDNGVGMSEPR